MFSPFEHFSAVGAESRTSLIFCARTDPHRGKLLETNEEFAFPEVEFAITPSGDYAPHPAFRAATEQFAGQTRLTADGTLEGYIAGQPFANDSLDPHDPTSGLKAAWNFNSRWQYYGQRVDKFGTILLRQGGTQTAPNGLPADLVKGGGIIERILAQRYQRVYFSRLAMLPEYHYTLPLPDAAQFEWKDSTEFTDPYEIRGHEKFAKFNPYGADIEAMLQREACKPPIYASQATCRGFFRLDFIERLSTVKVPALILCGDTDKPVPLETASKVLAEKIPDARLVIVQDAGHFPHIEKPEIVNEAIWQWLAEKLRA